MTNYQANHESLKKKIIMAISLEFTNVIAIPYDVGVARAMDDFRRVYKYGQDGIPDLFIIGPKASSRFLDVKTGRSGLSKEQKAWKKVFLEITGIDGVHEIRSVDAAIEFVKKEYPDHLIRRGIS